MFQRLLICTDFKDGLHRLVHFVPSLAAAGCQQITFLTSIPMQEASGVPRVDTEKVDQARERLGIALSHPPNGVDIRVEIESGKPTDVIQRVAKDHRVDLIMMGMSSRSLISETLLGSTTMQLYERTTVPLMTLRPQLISTYTAEELALRCRHLFRYVLLAYDGSNSAKALLEQIKQRVKQYPNRLQGCYLCWVVSDAGRREVPWEYKLEAATKELSAVKADLEALDLRVEFDVRCGDAVVEVVKSAMEPDVTAIATTASKRSKLMQWSSPSFATQLLRHSWYPVLYFPPNG